MRLIDDAVDGIPNRARLSRDEQSHELSRVGDWLASVEAAHHGDGPSGSTWAALADTFSRFALPLTPWGNLAAAMNRDVRVSSFQNWNELRDYMSGASVAPAVIFMYLVLMKPEHGETFRTDWPYEKVLALTEDFAIFCYLTHILRDVAVDLSLGQSGLVYIPTDELTRFGLAVDDLYHMRDHGQGTPAYTSLAESLAQRARTHLKRGRLHLSDILSQNPENGPALTYLISTYQKILDDLEAQEFDVFASARE